MRALKQLGEVVSAAHNGALVKCEDCGAKRVTQTTGQRINHVQTELSQAKEVVFRAEVLLEPIVAMQEEGPLRVQLDKQLDRARAQVSILEEQGGICQHRRLRQLAWELELNKMKARETEFSNSKVFATNLNIKDMPLAGAMFATRLKLGSSTKEGKERR